MCAGLSVVLAWMSYDRKQPAYYAAITTGEVVPMHSLSEPIVTSDFIRKWSALTVRLIYNLNFSTYQQQLARVQDRFSAAGWEKLNDALNASGLIKNLVSSRLIISSVISGPPIILSRVILNGRFTWTVQMQLLVTYTGASGSTKRGMIATLVIQRAPTLNAPQGIQIVSFSLQSAQP